MKLLPCLIMVFTLLFISGLNLSGQKKVNISGGFGFAETFNIGMRYQVGNQSQTGFSIGIWPSIEDSWLYDWDSLISLSVDFYYHVGGTGKFTEMSPWYFRTGLDYIRINGESWDDNNLESHLRFGKDFFFSEKIGFSLDAGIGVFLINESEFDSVFPAFGAGLFVRFN